MVKIASAKSRQASACTLVDSITDAAPLIVDGCGLARSGTGIYSRRLIFANVRIVNSVCANIRVHKREHSRWSASTFAYT